MAIPAFDPKELEIVGEQKTFTGTVPIYNFPVPRREAFIAAIRDRKPIWQLTGIEHKHFMPRLYPDNVARALVSEVKPFDNLTQGGGKDIFGIQWDYVPVAMGSMERPGPRLLEDANDWEDKIVWPDIDSWDWAGSAEENKPFFETDQAVGTWFQNGWFERLISFMGFEGAAMALIDEDQQEAALALFDRLADCYISIIDRFLEYFPGIDFFYMHDDWGSQRETFFSPDVVKEMIVPSMRKVTDHIHSLGRIAELHSCGQIMKQVPNMIAAGWDTWSGQSMNDSVALYEQYGDKIVLGVMPPEFDKDNTTEEEQRALAREFAVKFCRPDKPCVLSYGASSIMTEAYRQELYKESRRLFAQ
jgi:hypothetical protein